MTDDDREGFEPVAPDDAGDPAAAFEALRRTVEKQGGQIGAEMTVIRRGVEAAFDQFEKIRQPPDYGPDLGKIIQFLAVVEERLAAVEQSPILRNGPEHYARSLERSGEGLVPWPTKPVTPGVLRMTYQESSSRWQRTSR